MCHAHSACDTTPLTFETMLTDPMIRLMMDSDGVSTAELAQLLHQARIHMVQHEMPMFSAVR
jgi:hypothetical protein